MSLESFFGLDNADGQMSQEAAEKFREQMRKSAAAGKAIAGHHAQQKKKEGKLAHIFVKFLQSKGQSDIVFLIVRLLEQNVPGAFVLAMLLISDPELEKDLEIDLREKAEQLMAAKANTQDLQVDVSENPVPTENMLEIIDDDTLPSNVKAELNAWGLEILKAGLMLPNRTLQSVLTPDQKLKSIILDILVYSLDAYFDRHGLTFDDDKLKQFALISIQSVLIKLRIAADKMPDEELIETEVKES